MSSQFAWQMDLSFSDRLPTIVKIALAYRIVHPADDFTQANQHARSLENEAYVNASSREQYDQFCQELINRLEAEVPATKGNESQPDRYDVYSEGISLGNYVHAVHHNDGLFSTIYKAKPASIGPNGGTKLVALKVTNPATMAPPHDSRREARILTEAASLRVVALLEAFPLPGGQFALVFPFMPADLEQLLKEKLLTITQVKSHLRDLFQALRHLHALGIIHRDVKPSNILLTSATGPAYLADFGIAWSPNDKASEPHDCKITDVGTTSYRPPELLFGFSCYSCAIDLWAAGCVAAEAVMLTNQPLFDSGPLGSELALIQSIFKTLGTPNQDRWPEIAKFPDWGKMQFHEYPPQDWTKVLPGTSEDARDFVGKLLCYESGLRLTAVNALDHPFLKP